MAKQRNKRNRKKRHKTKNKKETFNIKKFFRGFNPFNLVWIAKALSDTFKVVIIVGLVLTIVFSIGYWNGNRQKPVIMGYKDFRANIVLADGKKHYIEVKNHILYFDKKMVRVADVPQLKHYGLCIRPKLFVGIGRDSMEAGIGASVAYYKKFNLDLFGTQKAVYVGISRDIGFGDWVKNSSLGAAIGTKFNKILDNNKKEFRFLVYWALQF